MICPFMTKDPVKEPKPCVDSCALYRDGYCSINVLAQKAMYDYEQEKKKKESTK